VLPSQEEPHEVLGRHGLDLAPQLLLGVAVDAGQEAPGAELLGAIRGDEMPPEHEAFSLQPGDGDRHVGFRQPRRFYKLGHRRWAPVLEVPPEQFGGRGISVDRRGGDR
jgi:hypothetical protein